MGRNHGQRRGRGESLVTDSTNLRIIMADLDEIPHLSSVEEVSAVVNAQFDEIDRRRREC